MEKIIIFIKLKNKIPIKLEIQIRYSSNTFSAVVLVIYNLASVFNSGTNFCVNIMFPVIFSFPFINACCGFNLPSAISTISASATVNVVSTLPVGVPAKTSPFFKSKANENGIIY